jgi:protoporphyrinogen oxidase
MRIAVLGGGISGIILSRLLQEKGHEIHLFEAQDSLGGLCRSRLINGFVYDLCGGHILNSRNSKTLQYILDITGKDNWIKHVRNTKIFLNNQFYKYPFENGLCDLPKEDNYECLMDYVRAHYERDYHHKPEPSNFHDWIIYRFGNSIAHRFLIPYNQKVWKYNLKHINTHWVDGIVPHAKLEDVVKSSIGIQTEGHTHQYNFYYPRKGGFQFLPDALSEPLNNVHLLTPVKSIENIKSKWVINGIHDFDDVISTISVHELLNLVKHIPPFVTATIESLWYNGLLTVFIGTNKPIDNDYNWVYLPEKDKTPANCITFSSNYSKYNVPEGCGSVIAEITLKAKTVPDNVEALTNNLVEFLDTSKIINKNDIVLSDSHFVPYAYPVYGLKFNELIQIINNYLNELKLKRFGRFATYSYNNIDVIFDNARDFVDKRY